jgi:hypothetical protein
MGAPPVRVKVLTERQLNRALLARQHLLERSSASLPVTLERVGGIQMQYAPSGYVGLWTRMRGLRRDRVTRALVRREAVQATLMRVTIHLVSGRDYWPLIAGVRRARRDWWLRTAAPDDVDDAVMVDVAGVVRDALAEGPQRQAALTDAIVAAGHSKATWGGAGLWVDLVRVPPSGTWERRRADLYGLADTWIAPSRAAEAQGLDLLLRRYLGAFGPATLKDAADWSGVPVGALTDVAQRMTLRRFVDEAGRDLIDLPRAPLPPADTPAPVRFLPTWDATLLANCRRTQILPERYRPLIFSTRTPHSVGTFLVDGQVAGTWRYDGGRIVPEPFEPLPAQARRELDAEARALAAFHT